ncbi:MAG: amino acid ABC transporter substrate-binding protein [Christensenellales bacterium]|jgi:polar amino acid transport system substrate-binding protein
MKKFFVLLLAVCLMLSAFTGCAPANVAEEPSPSESVVDTEKDESWEYIKANGKLIMGMDDSFPPMGFRDEGGNLVGFDVDLAKEVAARLEVELVLQAIDWGAKEMELDAKKIDVIWNGFTITDERKENVLFSDPYMENSQVVVVKEGSDINVLSDLAGKKVAVQDGSSAQGALEKDTELYESIGEKIDFGNNVSALMDLKIDKVDAVAVDIVVAQYYMTQEEGIYRILDEHLAPEEFGIGFRKGDVAFRDAVQQAINDMKADGKAEEISNLWFGENIIK